MANIELDGANKKIKVDSGDLTLDIPGDIILDADGADLVFADGGTNILKITNSSSDVVFQNQVDAKDIIFKQYDGTEVAKIDDDGSFKVANSTLSISQSSSDVIIKPLTDAKDIIFQQYDGTAVATVEDNGTFNIPASKLAIGGTAVTTTAAELNLIDGGTARGTTAIADGDGVLINDAGTMRMTSVETLATYIGGGVTESDSWRLTSSAANPSGVLASNWERCDTDGFALLGTGMSESSGIFSFPSTGHWLIMHGSLWNNTSADERYIGVAIQTTEDNSTYDNATLIRGNVTGGSSTRNGFLFGCYVFDVTNTTNDKVRLDSDNGNSNSTILGSTAGNETYLNFIKLADT